MKPTAREEMKLKRKEALSRGLTDPHYWSMLDKKMNLPSHSGGKKTGGNDRQPDKTEGKRKSHRPSYV